MSVSFRLSAHSGPSPLLPLPPAPYHSEAVDRPLHPFPLLLTAASDQTPTASPSNEPFQTRIRSSQHLMFSTNLLTGAFVDLSEETCFKYFKEQLMYQ